MQKQEFLKSHAGSPANTSLDLSALTAARVYSGRPLKLLCLHGGDMSGDGFQVMTMAMAEELKPLVQLSFPTAPYSEQPPGTDKFLWMAKSGALSESTWADSLTYLKQYIAKHGPFDGVLGYSMGACATACLLASVPEDTFRFAIVCGGYVPSTSPNIMRAPEAKRPFRTASLHCQGRLDKIMTGTGLSDVLMSYFDERSRELLRHPGGHDVPRDAQHLNSVAAFLMRFAE